ncbi:NAD-dependent protein deacetylase sirtuin-2 [Podochytrium sp. JEL0797]|nr:NAD-dependent protein deacetylase sirtuin-2 [Podochytrium sp. JEL0797]
MLADQGMLLRNYTQNIDTLERVAGLDEKYLVEAHGSFAGAKCVGKYRKPASPVLAASETTTATTTDNGSLTSSTSASETQPDDVTTIEDDSTHHSHNNIISDDSSDSSSDDFTLDESDFRACGKEYSQDWVRDLVFSDRIPECSYCQGFVKPNITFFGESLPNRFHALYPNDLMNADALIVIGTSLKVHPFAGLVNKVRQNVPRLLINMNVVGVDESCPQRGFDFEGDFQEYRRDAKFLGGADDGCAKLAALMGFGDKLHALMDQEYARIDLENAQQLQQRQQQHAHVVVDAVVPPVLNQSDNVEEEEEKEEGVFFVPSTLVVEDDVKGIDDITSALVGMKLRT